MHCSFSCTATREGMIRKNTNYLCAEVCYESVLMTLYSSLSFALDIRTYILYYMNMPIIVYCAPM